MNVQTNLAVLEIIEQPIGQTRFRYETETRYATLTGQREKTFPTVCLRNFNGEASILCSLYQTQKADEKPFPHPHSLVVRDGDSDPHEVIVSQNRGYQAIFQGMSIIHKKREHVEDELFKKLVAKLEYECGLELIQEEKNLLRKSAKKHAPNVDLNQAVLFFEAYVWIDGRRKLLCEPVFSTPINEKSKFF